MNVTRLVLAASSALLLVGCGGTAAPPPAPVTPSPAPATPAAPSPATPAGARIPLDQRVVPDLLGLPSPGGVKLTPTRQAYAEALTPTSEEDYAEERGKDAAALADKGYVAGAVKIFQDPARHSRATSTALQLGSPGQAATYERGLYNEEFSDGLSRSAQQGTVAGAAASHTVIDRSSEDGVVTNHAWASFVDGPFVYLVELEADGPPPNSQAVLDAANALLARVKGAPTG